MSRPFEGRQEAGRTAHAPPNGVFHTPRICRSPRPALAHGRREQPDEPSGHVASSHATSPDVERHLLAVPTGRRSSCRRRRPSRRASELARKANAARRPGPFGDLTNDDDRRHRPTGPTDDGSRPIRGGTRWVEERTGRTPRDPGGTNNGGPRGLMCGASNGTTGRFLPEGHMSARRSGHQSDRPPSPRALAAIAEAARRSREAGAGPGPHPSPPPEGPGPDESRADPVSTSAPHRPAQPDTGLSPAVPVGRAGGSAGSRAACPTERFGAFVPGDGQGRRGWDTPAGTGRDFDNQAAPPSPPPSDETRWAVLPAAEEPAHLVDSPDRRSKSSSRSSSSGDRRLARGDRRRCGSLGHRGGRPRGYGER